MWKKVLWSIETKIGLFDLVTKCYAWKNTIPTLKHGGGSMMLRVLPLCLIASLPSHQPLVDSLL